MKHDKGLSWKSKVLIQSIFVAVAIILAQVVEVVFGLALNPSAIYWVAFIAGLAGYVLTNRDRMLKDSDPNSTRKRARDTAQLMSNSDRD